jgi:MSHA biogenesis protein MshL
MDMDGLYNKISKLTVSCFILTVTMNASCTVVAPKNATSMMQTHATLKEAIEIDKHIQTPPADRIPKAVGEELLPPVTESVHPENQLTQRRFNVNADKMPAKTFFTGLVDGTSYNMVVDPSIDGNITLSLKNVTIEEAMRAVRDIYGYEYHRTSYGYEIMPPALETQLFNVNYLDLTRIGKSTTEMVSGQVTDVGTISVGNGSGGGSSGNGSGSGSSNGSSSNNNNNNTGTTGASNSVSSSTVNTNSEMNFWKELDKTLKQMVPIDKGRSVVVNSQAGVVIVHAFPYELHQVARYLERIQTNLQRQIVIEAKVLEVNLNDGFDSGVDWSLLGNPLNADALISQSGNGPNSGGASGSGGFNNTGLQNFDPVFTINIKGSFRALINFLQTQGNVQTLSSPRISTVNNQKAVIKVGQDQFFVTGVSTTNAVVGTNTLPSQNVNLTPFFSGVTLDVTPQIGKDGTVLLHIHPAVSVVSEQNQTIVLGSTGSAPNTLSLPLALSTIRESDNIVRAKNGQIVVIGGLMQNGTSETIAGTPFLSRIPFIGALFRRTSQTATRSELVILLRPVLVNNKVWTKTLERTDNDFHRDNRDFHLGGLPDDFGTRGEITDAENKVSDY